MYCPICGAELSPEDRCRFAVPAEEAPWVGERHGAAGVDRDSRLPLARWILHHPEEAGATDLEWARRTAGVQPDPD